MTAPERARAPRRAVVVGAALALAALVGVVIWAPWSATTPDGAATPAPVGRTVQLSIGTVEKTSTQKGTLQYPVVKSLLSRSTGTMTAVPAVGATLDRGDTLYEVDTVPTTLLIGTSPVWRDLSVGAKGPDVLQLEQNLSALGYFSRVPDEEFLEPTAQAVRAWQKALGVPETGVVLQSAIAVAPSAVRVGSTPLPVEAAVGAGTTVLTLTARTPSVEVMLPLAEQTVAVVGASVSVTMPDGSTAPGSITSVGQAQAASSNGSGGESDGSSPEQVLPVEIDLADPGAAGQLQAAVVQVQFVGERHENVLTVAVDALLARPGGGFELEEIDDSGEHHRVAVTLGLVADGLAEVSGDGVHEGMTVGAAKE
ncbi:MULTISPECIES: peptidoglycan-binding protein [unclassified Rathayibacter]|uniref:peptidoglycan-binding protein n=1 Tax=unclassified Rathayibacter TaxID=2609250 RepID=UPI00188C129A|nr:MULTISPECIES: peptidoglycan-binding protein [unclassified Rathayibacter]MBF4463091.1 peptidoglycan-binding protein [Rathayibacter sp. VKM Ac-2879]MBF4504672.1 peptidoglycan-binding protein [Rathayibacter sp. VKM Ac-2878]